MLAVIMLSAVMLSVTLLNVIIISEVMLSVAIKSNIRIVIGDCHFILVRFICTEYCNKAHCANYHYD
jgi:hypothetical protein